MVISLSSSIGLTGFDKNEYLLHFLFTYGFFNSFLVVEKSLKNDSVGERIDTKIRKEVFLVLLMLNRFRYLICT